MGRIMGAWGAANRPPMPTTHRAMPRGANMGFSSYTGLVPILLSSQRVTESEPTSRKRTPTFLWLRSRYRAGTTAVHDACY